MKAKAISALATPGRAALYLRVSTGRRPNTTCPFPISVASFVLIVRARASKLSRSMSSQARPTPTIADLSFNA